MFQIGKKQLKIPIIQGGMGIGISLSGLAAAVAEQGGAGVISAAQIGFREPDFRTNNLEANCRAIHKEMKKAREKCPEGLIGFNVMVAMNHYKEYVKEIVKAGADFIVSGAGLPTELPEYVAGSDIAIAPIVSTEKSAKVILRYWDKKYSRIPDFMVIEGPKAGGHLGFKKEQLKEYIDNRTISETYQEEVKKILKIKETYEKKYDQKIPIAYAGGIDSKAAYDQAMQLGVDAVQIATRFVTTDECDADIRFKETYLQSTQDEIRIVKSPVGMPGRAIQNTFLKKLDNGQRIPPKHCLACIKTCNPKETPYCITEALLHAAKGEIEEALLFCGANAYRTKKIETVKEVVDSFLSLQV